MRSRQTGSLWFYGTLILAWLSSVVGLMFTLWGCSSLDCEGTACLGGDDDQTPTPAPAFEATLEIVAPYGWEGTFYTFPYDGRPGDPDCSDATDCSVELEEKGTYQVAITGDTFLCVNQFATFNNTGQTIEIEDEWLGEGQCGLAPPDGQYGSYEVHTRITNLDGTDKVWIWIGSWGAIVTDNTFFYQDDEYLLEGEISDDLAEIYFHRILSTGETEGTLTL